VKEFDGQAFRAFLPASSPRTSGPDVFGHVFLTWYVWLARVSPSILHSYLRSAALCTLLRRCSRG